MNTPQNHTPIFPIRDKILVRPDPDDEMIGRIIVPDAAAELKKFVGTVLAVGEGIATDKVGADNRLIVVPLAVKPGDKIVYDKYAGMRIEWPPNSRDEVILLVEANVLAIIKE